VRLASGYQLTDDFIDLAKYLGSTPWAKDFHCPAGDEVVFEFLVVDGAGSGALTVQVHMDGVRRKGPLELPASIRISDACRRS
jgi:hypothetical protein